MTGFLALEMVEGVFIHLNLTMHTGGTAQHGQSYTYGSNWQMSNTPLMVW